MGNRVSFKPVSTQKGGRRVFFSQIECGCGATHDIPTNTAGAPPSEFLRNKGAAAGWEAKGNGSWKCPACVAAKTPGEKPASLAPVVDLAPYQPTPAECLGSGRGQPFSRRTIEEAIRLLDQGLSAAAIETRWGIRNGGLVAREVMPELARQGRPLISKVSTQIASYRAWLEMQRGASPETAAAMFGIAPQTLKAHVDAFVLMTDEARARLKQQIEGGGSVPAPLSSATMKAAFDLLDAEFDKAAGRYRAGWSDEKVAASVQADAKAIGALRLEVYGPIKADPRMDAIFERLGRLEAEAAACREQVTETTAKLGRVEKGIEATLAELTAMTE